MKASRVDKLQVELNGQREKLEDASRSQAKLKVYLTVTIKYTYLILRFCRLSHFVGINKCAVHDV